MSRCIKSITTEKEKNLFLVGTYNDIESSIILCDYDENTKHITHNEFHTSKNERIIDLYPSLFNKNIMLLQVFNSDKNVYGLKSLNYNFEDKKIEAEHLLDYNHKSIFE